MAASECSLNYHRMKISELELFAGGLKETYYKHNPPFTSPPVPWSQVHTLIENYINTFAAYDRGGTAQRPLFMMAKKALLQALDDIRDNVNEVAQGNENTILSGGFKPRKVTRSKSTPPATPQTERINRGNDRQLLPFCRKVPGAEYYTCIISEGMPLAGKLRIEDNKLIISGDIANLIIDEGKSRKKSYINLKQKETYYVYFFARNAAGLSNLSEGRSIICV